MMKAIKRILVVDGEKEFADTVTRHLKRKKFILQSANNGEDAREKIHNAACPISQYDLVITDVIMPIVSGIELLQWIKEHHSEISVLVVSGLGDRNLVLRTIRPEMDDCCQKPVTPCEMMRLIGNIDKKRKEHYIYQC
jgi:DNA-binding response OmpR family regulator